MSSAEGYFSFPLLLPGNYDLTVQKDGFETQSRTGIKVETGTISTMDVELAVSAVSQSVNVEASVPPAADGDVHRFECGRSTEPAAYSERIRGAERIGSGRYPCNRRRPRQQCEYLIDGGTAQNLTLVVCPR